MKVLIACEESQRVCAAFRKKGHEAYSCDLQPCSGGHPDWHINGDVREELKKDWDLIIAFPPCTDISTAGACWFKEKIADGRQQRAIDFFMLFTALNCEKVAIENPIGIMPRHFRKYDQIIEPYMFGEPFKKKTCLWLKNLPCLIPTKIVEPEFYHISSGSNTRGRRLKLSTKHSTRSSKERSKTFQGIADAMAEQWG